MVNSAGLTVLAAVATFICVAPELVQVTSPEYGEEPTVAVAVRRT